MDTSPSGSPQWTEHDLKMITTVDVFLHKPAILKKAEKYLNRLKETLAGELAGSENTFPPATDIVKGQLVRGENHKGFPFLSLDMPQMFSKTEMFTYRTLFWWGHCLVFSLILKGEALPLYLQRLTGPTVSKDPFWKDVYLAITPTPWEWELKPDHFKNVRETAPDELRLAVETIQYMKLCRFFPVGHPSFPALNWTQAGLETWTKFYSLTQSES